MHSLQQKPATAPTPRRVGEIYPSDGPALGYAILRATLGLVFVIYGANKLRNLTKVVDGIAGQFNDTILPAWAVRPYAYALPFVELLIGISLLLGLLTRGGLVLGGLTMASLIFGTALRGDSEKVPSQLIFATLFFVLLATIRWNVIAIDRKLKPGIVQGIEIGH